MAIIGNIPYFQTNPCISNFYILLIWCILCERIQGGGLMKEHIKYQRVWCPQRPCHFSKLLDLPKSVIWGPWNKPWTRSRVSGARFDVCWNLKGESDYSALVASFVRAVGNPSWKWLYRMISDDIGPSQLWSCSKKRFWKQEPFPMLQVSMPSMPIEFAYEDILD